MAEMKISETHFLKSATQEEISTTNSHLLREGFKSLVVMRSHYFRAFAHMEVKVAQSRCGSFAWFSQIHAHMCASVHPHTETHTHAHAHAYTGTHTQRYGHACP